MESKLASVAKLLQRLGEELPRSASAAASSNAVDAPRKGGRRQRRNNSSISSKNGSTTPRNSRNKPSPQQRATQLARLEQLRDYVADDDLSLRTRGACSYAMHMYLAGNKHLLKTARQRPGYAQAVVHLINDIKDTSRRGSNPKESGSGRHSQAVVPVQGYDSIYLQAVDTVALIYGKKSTAVGSGGGGNSGGSGSGGGFVPISLDEPVVQSRADELHAQRVELDDAAAARAAALSHEDDDEAKHHHHLPSFVVGRRSPQSSSSDRLADVLSGQPIPIGATSDIFAEAFDVDASAHAQQLGVRTCVSLHTLCSVRSVG